LKAVFMGTPDFAASVLAHVLDRDGCEVVCAYTQPDRPSGRGRTTVPTPVKSLAQARGIPVRQPADFKSPDTVAALADLAPDVLLVAAYGLILPASVLDIPTHGAINVHASLLPKYRGAAPIQRAIMAGEPVTGITIMAMSPEMDAGDMLLQRALGIAWDDTAQDIHDQLADMGGRLLVEVLQTLARGRLTPIPQDHGQATYAPKLTKDEGELDLTRPAKEVHDRVRALTPWPGAWFTLQRPDADPLKVIVYPGRFADPPEVPARPGSVLGLDADDRLQVATGQGIYLLDRVKPANAKPMDARSFWCGYLDGCADPRCACPGT
jgi:methionyl-tRNA formyltransferase